ncbi:hypothetical protein J1N35_022460, partial [Gossypium stocksii]
MVKVVSIVVRVYCLASIARIVILAIVGRSQERALDTGLKSNGFQIVLGIFES